MSYDHVAHRQLLHMKNKFWNLEISGNLWISRRQPPKTPPHLVIILVQTGEPDSVPSAKDGTRIDWIDSVRREGQGWWTRLISACQRAERMIGQDFFRWALVFFFLQAAMRIISFYCAAAGSRVAKCQRHNAAFGSASKPCSSVSCSAPRLENF